MANPNAATVIAIAIAIIMLVIVWVDVFWKLRSTCRNAVSPEESYATAFMVWEPEE